VPTRVLSALVALVAAGLVVDLFFHWTEGEGGEFNIGATTGLDSAPGFFSFATGLALVLWEVLGALRVQRTGRSDSLVAFFLAAGAAVAALATLIHLKWGAPSPFSNDLAVAALLTIPLSILLLAGAVAHLGLHVIAARGAAAR
jgi:hypothetical protein